MTETLSRETRLSPLFRMSLTRGSEASVLHHLDAGAALHARDERGRQPLMLAAAAGRADICRLLLSRGADLRQTDGTGQTAADLAVAAGHAALAAILRPQSMVQADPAPGASPPDDEPDAPYTEGWIPEAETQLRPTDSAVAAYAESLQDRVSAYRTLEEAAAWDQVRVELPSAGPARLSVRLERLIRRIAAGLEAEGRACEVDLEALLSGLGVWSRDQVAWFEPKAFWLRNPFL